MVAARFRTRQDGWTLVEMTIVLSIIAILATIALVGYRNALTRSREAVLKENLFRMRDAIDQYHADKGEYPGDLGELAAAGYLRAVPKDPFTSASDSWVTEPADYDPAHPLARGVHDVRSGHEGIALDGTSYSEW